MAKKLATLTAKENRDWEHFFAHYLSLGKRDATADRETWKDMQRVYSRLRKFDGCKPYYQGENMEQITYRVLLTSQHGLYWFTDAIYITRELAQQWINDNKPIMRELRTEATVAKVEIE